MFMENNEAPEAWWVTAFIGTLKAVAFVCDIITFPIHLAVQRPWMKRELSRRPKARIVEKTDRYVTVRSLSVPSTIHIWMVREKIFTMDQLLKAAVPKYENKRCLGTRTILNEQDEPQPNGRVFKKYNMGEYTWRNYRDVEAEATLFGAGLREIGCRPRENVVMFAETRAEWMVAAHGCFKQSIPVVTLYATLGEEAIAHGINETEVTTVITTHDLLSKFRVILHRTPLVHTVVYMEDQLKKTDTHGFKEGVQIISYSEILERGRGSKIDGVPSMPNDTAIIMYTSGSTGVPKGVKLTHRNLCSTVKAFSDMLAFVPSDVLMGFLPLAHVFELLAETVCIIAGMPIGYSTPLTMTDTSSKIMKGCKGDASLLRPTCMTTVPLIMDRISKGITEKVSKSGALHSALFRWAYDYKAAWMKRGYDTPFLNRMLFKKASALLGGRIRVMICGGAPLSPDTHNQIKICLCCGVVTGYGLTETTSCATVLDMMDRSTGRVGAPTTMSDLRLINWEEGGYRVTNKPFPQGEILIGGESVSEGYYKNEEKTREDFLEMDGTRWFKSGDIGEVQDDGCIKIIDRKKDLVKLQAGEYVSLGKVEAELKTCPYVENICVYGDSSKSYTVALVVPNQKLLNELAAKLAVGETDFDSLCQNPLIEKAMLKELAEHAKKCKLEKFEVPAAVKLVTEVWSPDMGLVTAAFKLKRKDIQERYKEDIKRMYAS